MTVATRDREIKLAARLDRLHRGEERHPSGPRRRVAAARANGHTPAAPGRRAAAVPWSTSRAAHPIIAQALPAPTGTASFSPMHAPGRHIGVLAAVAHAEGPGRRVNGRKRRQSDQSDEGSERHRGVRPTMASMSPYEASWSSTRAVGVKLSPGPREILTDSSADCLPRRWIGEGLVMWTALTRPRRGPTARPTQTSSARGFHERGEIASRVVWCALPPVRSEGPRMVSGRRILRKPISRAPAHERYSVARLAIRRLRVIGTCERDGVREVGPAPGRTGGRPTVNATASQYRSPTRRRYETNVSMRPAAFRAGIEAPHGRTWRSARSLDVPVVTAGRRPTLARCAPPGGVRGGAPCPDRMRHAVECRDRSLGSPHQQEL